MNASFSEASMPTSEYERIQQTVLPLLELADDDFWQASGVFVAGRVAELEASAGSGALDKNGNFQGFLGPDIEINAADLTEAPGFVLDDPEIYASVMPLFRANYQQILQKTDNAQLAYRNALYVAAQRTQEQYFGDVYIGAASHEKRDGILFGAGGRISVAELKGVARCAERAAVANNVVMLFGINPVLEHGELQVENHSPMPHAFLLVPNSRGEARLFDPTNPALVLDQTGKEGAKLLQTMPAIYPIEDQLASARTTDISHPGLPITVMHKDYHVVEGDTRLVETPYRFTLTPVTPDLRPY